MNANASDNLVITIDGPAGVGKSTVARKLASRLRFVHLNSGALFRAVARAVKLQGIDARDEDAVEQVARSLRFHFSVDSTGETRFTVDDIDISSQLLQEQMGEGASQIAVQPKLRDVLLQVQRKCANEQPIVVEGRDAGSVVFPDAALKFYLDAPLDVRASRRAAQVGEQSGRSGLGGTAGRIQKEIEERDVRDSTRKVAPQVRPADAVLVDTADLSVDEVVDWLYQAVREKLAVR